MAKDKLTKAELENLEEAAMSGDAEAQLKLGIYYKYSDAKEALKWFKKAANSGSYDAAYRAADILMYNDELQNEEMALIFYKNASDHGDIRAMYKLAFAYIMNDNEEGYALMRQCAEQKSADACFFIGEQIEWAQKGFGTDFKDALKYYESAFEYGSAKAGYRLALIYAEGKSVTQDIHKAKDYAKRAIEIEEDSFKLIEIYYATGDLNKEIHYAKKYVKQYPEHPYANYYYARALMRSPKSEDQKAAAKAYGKTRKLLEAEKDISGTEYVFLAEIYKNGYGVAADEEKAKEMYQKAMENGVSDIADEYMMLNKNARKAVDLLEYDIATHRRESYTLYGIKISLESDLEYYAFCRKAATMLAAACKFYYEESYNVEIKDIKDYISSIPKILRNLNELIPKSCCNWLDSKFEISVSEQEFYEKYLQEYIENDFAEPYSKILEKVLKAELGNANYDAFMKSIDFHGGWFAVSDGSVSGNLKAMGSTMLLNVGTDIAFEALKSVGSALGSLWKDMKLSLMFDNPRTKNAYLDIFDGKYLECIVGGLFSELKKAGVVSELYFPEFDGEKYFKKCDLDSKDHGRKDLVFAIINDPFEFKYYDFALTCYGDENGELTFLAEKFGINLQGIKERLSQEFYEKYCQSLHDYDKNRELFVQLLTYIHYQGSPELKLFDTRMMEDNEQMALLLDEENERKTEYIDVLCAILEVTFHFKDKKHYKKLKEGGRQFAEFISVSETFGFDAIYTRQFKKMNKASGDAVIKAAEKHKKSYYKLFVDWELNDDRTHLEELADDGFVWAYGSYAYDIREDNPVKALVTYDKYRSFTNVSDLAIPGWVEKIVEEQKDAPSVKKWAEKNAKRFIKDRPYFVFEGQKSIKHSLTSEEVYGMVNESSISNAIDEFYSDIENGADIRYFSDIMGVLKKKYQRYCIEKAGDKETIDIWLRRPLLKEIWEKIGDHQVKNYGVCFRVNGIDDDFGHFLNAAKEKNRDNPFVFANNEIPLVIFTSVERYLSDCEIVITDKNLYMYDNRSTHNIITIDLKSISESKYNFIDEFLIVQNDGNVTKLERGQLREDDYKNLTKKIKPIIDLIRNYDFLKFLPKLSVTDLREMQTILNERFSDVAEIKKYRDSIDHILRNKELYAERKAHIEDLCDGLSKFDYDKCQKVRKELIDYDAPDDMKEYYLKELNDKISYYEETTKWNGLINNLKDDDLDSMNDLYKKLSNSSARSDVSYEIRKEIIKKYSAAYKNKYGKSLKEVGNSFDSPGVDWIGNYPGETHISIIADQAYKRATGKEYLPEIAVAVWNIDKLTAKVTTIMTHYNVYIVVKNKLYSFSRRDKVTVQIAQKLMSSEITVHAADQSITFTGMDKDYAERYNIFMQFMYKIAPDQANPSPELKKEAGSRPISTTTNKKASISQIAKEVNKYQEEKSKTISDIPYVNETLEQKAARLKNSFSGKSLGEMVKICADACVKNAMASDFKHNMKLGKQLGIPYDEKILLGHDSTIFSSGKEGFALTEKFVYVRLNGIVTKIPVHEIKNYKSIQWRDDNLYLESKILAHVCGTGLRTKACLLLMFQEIAIAMSLYGSKKDSVPQKAPEQKKESERQKTTEDQKIPEVQEASVQKKADLKDINAVATDIGRRCNINSKMKHPFTFVFKGMRNFEEMKRKALSKTTLKEPDNENILFIYDNTLLGNCKSGTIITDKYVYAIKKRHFLPVNYVQNVSCDSLVLRFETDNGVFETKCDTIDRESKAILAEYLNELINTLNYHGVSI